MEIITRYGTKRVDQWLSQITQTKGFWFESRWTNYLLSFDINARCSFSKNAPTSAKASEHFARITKLILQSVLLMGYSGTLFNYFLSFQYIY